jgi:protein-tyrosine-phosphatase
MDDELNLDELNQVQAGFGSNKESMENQFKRLESELYNTNDPYKKQEIMAQMKKIQQEINQMMDSQKFGGR